MDEVKVECQDYYFIARRADRSWGHAIDVSVFDSQNVTLGHLSFFCHPEFSEFEQYQSYETFELVNIASKVISQGMKSGRYKLAWESGFTLILRFNDPNAELPNI